MSESSFTPPLDDRSLQLFQLYANIGSIASLWSLLERAVDTQCWRLASVSDDKGACMTGQIQSIRAKLISLESLAKLSGGSEDLLKRLRNFRDKKCILAAEKRNRFIHDPMSILDNEIIVETLVVTNKGLVKLTAPPSLDEFRAFTKEIHKLYQEFSDFWPELKALYAP